MPPEVIFQLHLVFGYVACLLYFSAYVLPRLKSMDRVDAQRVIATVHIPERRPEPQHSSRGLRPRKSAASGRNESSTIADKGSFNLTAFEGEAK